MLGEQRPFTDEQHRQSLAAAQREWDGKWAPMIDTYADELRDQFAVPPAQAEPADDYAELMAERQATREAVRRHAGHAAVNGARQEGGAHA